MAKPGDQISPPNDLLLPRKQEKPSKPPNAVIYIRVSTPKQARDGYSPADQERDCRKYCKEHGYTVKMVFFDRGVSAYKRGVRRSGLDDLLEFCRKHASQISLVVFYNIRRMGRNSRYLIAQEELEALGIEFASPTLKFGKSAHEKLAERTAFVQGQFESDEKSEYAIKSWLNRLEKGRLPRPAPIGYINVKDETRSRGTIVKHDPVRAPIIKRCFEKFVYNDLQRATIYKWALRKGLTSLRTGEPYARGSFFEIFSNPIYAGLYYEPRINPDKYIKLEFEGIVSHNVFYASLKKIRGQAVSYTPKEDKGDRHPLQQVVRCYSCGRRLSASNPNKGKYGYYHFRKHLKGCTTPGLNIPASKAEKSFARLLNNTLSEPPLIEMARMIAKKRQEDDREEIRQEAASLEKKKAETEKVLEGLVDKFAKGDFTKPEYLTAKERNEKKLEKLEKEIEEAQKASQPLDLLVEQVEEALVDLGGFWELLSNTDRKAVAGALFPDGVYCDKAGTITLPTDKVLFGLVKPVLSQRFPVRKTDESG